MSTRGSGGLAALAAALALHAWAPVAEAQEAIDRSFVTASGAQGYTLPPGLVPALRGFDVGYTRSDHQVNLLLLGPVTTARLDSGEYTVALQDADGNDAVSGAVRADRPASPGSPPGGHAGRTARASAACASRT